MGGQPFITMGRWTIHPYRRATSVVAQRVILCSRDTGTVGKHNRIRQAGINLAVDSDHATLPGCQDPDIPHVGIDARWRDRECAGIGRGQYLGWKDVGNDHTVGDNAPNIRNRERERDAVARLQVRADHVFVDADIRANYHKRSCDCGDRPIGGMGARHGDAERAACGNV